MPQDQTIDAAQTDKADDDIFPDELSHLENIQQLLASALDDTEKTIADMELEYSDTRMYLSQNRSEIDPHEMFQTQQILQQIDSSGSFIVKTRDRIKKQQASPYFARIDFCETGKDCAVFYIGQFSFNHGRDIIIFDWRAPVSSMFYDCELGPAGYTAPRGEITGELTKKRQFKITGGHMEYALESSMQIHDDVLQRELSHSSDEKMKSIIATLQREQNLIIRNEKAGSMIIQGVAGSGKTSIALHRIAFLLYRFKDSLKAQNISILSPNSVFADYISNVLPELGEEPVYELGFSDIAFVQLEKVIDYEDDIDPFENDDRSLAERIAYKSSLDFLRLMDGYIAQLPSICFEAMDLVFEPFTIKKAWLQSRFNAYSRYSIKKRLDMLADDINEELTTLNYGGHELPKLRAIKKELKATLKYKKSLKLYQEFYRQIHRPDMLVMAGRNKLEWNDVFPFIYLHAAFEGVTDSRIIKHLVIDEMQDYSPVQYAVINLLFPCSKTILGDFSQYVNPNHRHSLDDLQKVYPEAQLMRLNKSYRSSYEIIQFAKRI